MRVADRVHRDERGAVLIIVAAFALVAVLSLAFVIDIGNQRQNRRQLTTATDSVALAVAQEWVGQRLDPSFDCDDTDIDDDLAVANNPVGNESPSYECAFGNLQGRRGAVTVNADEIAEYAFEGVTGLDSGDTNSLTRVAVDVVPGGGLRPLGLCLLDPQIAEWVEAFENEASPPFDEIVFDKSDNDCGGSSGNWGELQLPGAGNGLNAWRDVVLDGAPEDVVIGDWIATQTGIGMNSAETTFEELKAQSPIFSLPVYQNNPGNPPGGPGDNAMYQVAGFLEVELMDFEAMGGSATLTIRPLRWDSSGPCCFVNEYNAQYSICDVGTTGGALSADSDDNCLPPLSPPSPPDLDDPDPGSDCDPVTATLMPAPSGNGAILDSDLTVEVEVVDAAECPAFNVRVYKVADAGTLAPEECCTVSGNAFTGRFKRNPPGSWKWADGNYRLQVFDGTEQVDSFDFSVS